MVAKASCEALSHDAPVVLDSATPRVAASSTRCASLPPATTSVIASLACEPRMASVAFTSIGTTPKRRSAGAWHPRGQPRWLRGREKNRAMAVTDAVPEALSPLSRQADTTTHTSDGVACSGNAMGPRSGTSDPKRTGSESGSRSSAAVGIRACSSLSAATETSMPRPAFAPSAGNSESATCAVGPSDSHTPHASGSAPFHSRTVPELASSSPYMRSSAS
mmetsp:Transcript_22579/g.85572  ORF Transcript_22579/g.85572 Transcript_22579/m.85572 type:complete len:220 (+) Transcript_22579:2061-2720(+)